MDGGAALRAKDRPARERLDALAWELLDQLEDGDWHAPANPQQGDRLLALYRVGYLERRPQRYGEGAVFRRTYRLKKRYRRCGTSSTER